MSDLISRQAAIDAIYEICNEPVAWLIRAAREIEKLPSAQPEERTETHACDFISRQAAIDAFDLRDDTFLLVAIIKSKIKKLPSAQPETAKRIVGKSRDGTTLWYQCDMCNEPVDAQDDFCRGCGRRLTDG